MGRKQKELKEQKVDKQPKNNEGGITGKGWKKGQSKGLSPLNFEKMKKKG